MQIENTITRANWWKPRDTEQLAKLWQNIRIFNGSEVRIENSVTRVTVGHHKVCRLPNSYPEWQNFQFALNNHYRFFFLHTLQQQHLSLHTGYFFNFTPNMHIFFHEIFGLATNCDVGIGMFVGKWCQNWQCDVKRRPEVKNKSSYIPSCINDIS